MLSQFTWEQYIGIIGGGLAIYYLACLVWIGMQQWKKQAVRAGSPLSIKPKRIWTADEKENKQQESTAPTPTTVASEEAEKAKLTAAMHELVNEIQAYLSATEPEAEKDKIIQSLSHIIGKYPSVSKSAFREGITNLVAVTTETECNVHLTAEDLNAIWR